MITPLTALDLLLIAYALFATLGSVYLFNAALLLLERRKGKAKRKRGDE